STLFVIIRAVLSVLSAPVSIFLDLIELLSEDYLKDIVLTIALNCLLMTRLLNFRTVSAVWQDFESLSLLRKITPCGFVLDLGLMCDALQEFSEYGDYGVQSDAENRKLAQKSRLTERKAVSGFLNDIDTKSKMRSRNDE
ncbi:hypothetical protein L9F63_022085, partial [Diploptera punctata]